MIWTILSGRIQEILDKFTLADLINKDSIEAIRKEYSRMPLLNPDLVLAESDAETTDICPTTKKQGKTKRKKTT